MVSTTPAIYLPLAAQFSTGVAVTRDCDLVIEGFPRSANSFAEAAFRLSQAPRELKIAHHTHAAAQVIAAVDWKLPTLVVIRNPVDACRSLLMHAPGLFSVRDLLNEYVVFHKSIEPKRDGFALARFETTTTDFNSVIAAVNAKSSTDFAQTSESLSAGAFAMVDQLAQERGVASEEGVSYSPTRSEEDKAGREREKLAARAAIQEAEGSRLWIEAHDLFERFNASADV